MPRIAPIAARSELPAEHQPVADAIVKVNGEIRGPWGMLLHSPKLAAGILPLVPFFHHESIVEGRLRSVAILAAVRELDAEYVWSAQVVAARRNGVREELIELVRTKGDAAGLPVEEREIVDYTRQLMRAHRVDQATFSALEKRYGAQWLVELTATMGYFALVSGIANAFEVPAPPGGAKLPKSKVESRKSKVERD
jgi:4-carboxymuconolactone decarboxylase